MFRTRQNVPPSMLRLRPTTLKRLQGSLSVDEASPLLRAFLADREIVTAACACLLRTLKAHDDTAMPDPFVLLDLLRAHASDVDVLHYGCRVLLLAARHPHSCDLLVQKGAPESLVAVLRNHPTESRLQGIVCQVLCVLATTLTNQAQVVNACGLEMAATAQRGHLADAGVQCDRYVRIYL